MKDWLSQRPPAIIIPTDNIVRGLFTTMAQLPPEANTSPDEAMAMACTAIVYREHIDYAHAAASFRARLHLVEPTLADQVTMLYVKFLLELMLIYVTYGLWGDNNECQYHYYQLQGNDIMLRRFEDNHIGITPHVYSPGTPGVTYSY